MNTLDIKNNKIHFSFDATPYFKQNPDVAEAVRTGVTPSALHHFIQHGRLEQRAGVPAETRRMINALMDDIRITPPPHLLYRVSENTDAEAFVITGLIHALQITHLLQPLMPKKNSTVLDFGCGSGRLTPFLTRILSYRNLLACDIDEEAITWCTSQMGDICQFFHNDHLPPLPYDTGSIDAVVSISIFTHLPEEIQLLWLNELKRIVKPRGLLLITTHGEEITLGTIRSSFPEKYESFKSSGYFYFTDEPMEGLPEYYGATGHSRRYIEEVWGKYFIIEDILPKAINGHQDMIICRNR